MISTAVLARLLSPEDYGLIGMTTAVTGFIQLFQSMGLSEATIQCKEINHKQASALFWLNGTVGVGLTALALAISPLVANFYDEPRVIGIMYALSINFVISSFAVQHTALLKRQMQFAVLAKASMLAMAVGVIVAIVGALQGLGYWALVLMFVSSSVTNSICIWLACSWCPGLPDFNSGIGPMLSFGANIIGFNCVNYFSRNLDNVLIGRVWGPQQLGLYAKAYQLLLLPINQINSPVTSVAMPTLSRLQDNPERFQRYYYKAISLITIISMPIVCFLFAAAADVIMFFLGEQWLDAVPIFRFLIPAALIGTFNVAPGWAFRSLGRAGTQFRLGIVTSTLNVLIFIVGVRWGAVGVAAAYGLSRPFIMIVNIIYCYRGTFLNPSDLMRTLATPLFNSLVSAMMLFLCIQLIPNSLNIIFRLFIEVLTYLAFYLLMWSASSENRSTIKECLTIFSSLRQ